MKTILVVGDTESGKDDLLEFVLDRGRDILPKFGYLRFDDFLIKDHFRSYDKNLDQIRAFQKDFQENIKKKFSELKKSNENLIINAHFFARMKHGFISLMSAKLYNTFKPDAVIIIELYPKKLDPRFKFMLKKDNPLQIRNLRLEQDIIRKFATMFTSSTDSMLKVVQVDKDEVKEAFDEIMDVVKFVLGEK